MKGVLPGLVRWDVVPVQQFFFLASLIGPVQNIFFLTVHYFNAFAPIAQQAGQAVVLGRLSVIVCLWTHLTSDFYDLYILQMCAPSVKACLSFLFTKLS
jgi:hypothetical protein